MHGWATFLVSMARSQKTQAHALVWLFIRGLDPKWWGSKKKSFPNRFLPETAHRKKQVIITKPAGMWKWRPIFISHERVKVFVCATLTQSSGNPCIELHAAMLASQQAIIGTSPCARRLHTQITKVRKDRFFFENKSLRRQGYRCNMQSARALPTTQLFAYILR